MLSQTLFSDEPFLEFVFGKTRTLISDRSLTHATKAFEYILAQHLKNMCYANGREIEQTKSAKVLHFLGLVYRLRTSDKQSLIQSAALLCSAIVRQPDNIFDITQDLRELIRFVLKRAGAQNLNVDLLEQADLIFNKMTELRDTVKAKLAEIVPIPECLTPAVLRSMEISKIEVLRSLQDNISTNYTAMMSDILQLCIHVIGEFPCKYALVGMGSLAKQEITPYSDFESIILLEEGVQDLANYNEILEHVRWLAVLFQIVLVSFGETIIRFMHIPSLNDPYDRNKDWFYDAYTPCGICPDGFAPHACKNPLGRQHETTKKTWKTELIMPVSEMLRYLETEEDLKNGYHLADVLTKTCFVAGDKLVYEQFLEGVKQAAANHVGVEQLRNQLAEDIDNFNIHEHLASLHFSDTFDMKRVVYRSTTLFIAALGRYLNVQDASSFHTVDKLEEIDEISEKFAHQLRYAIALACEIRLRAYTEHDEQHDRIHWNGSDESIAPFRPTILTSVGAPSLADYFITGVTLQKFVQARLLDDPEAEEKAFRERETSTIDQPMMHMIFGFHEKALTGFRTLLPQLRETGQHDIASWKELSLVLCLTKLNMFSECVRYCLEFLRNNVNPLKKELLRISGECLLRMGCHIDALLQLEESLQLCSQDENYSTVLLKADCHFYIGDCLQHLQKQDPARKQYKSAQDIYAAGKTKQTVIDCLEEIGKCWLQEQKFAEALETFEEMLKLQRTCTSDEARDGDIAATLHLISECLFQLRRKDDMKECVNDNLNILDEILEDYEDNGDCEMESLVVCRERVAECLDLLDRKDEALECREETVNLLQETLRLNLSPSLTALYSGLLGNSFKHMNRVDDAVKCFEDEIKAREMAAEDASVDRVLALSLDKLARYNREHNRESEALRHFERELHIWDMRIQYEDSVESKASVMKQQGICLMELNRHADALQRFERELQLRRSFKPDCKESQFSSLLEDGTAEAICLRPISYALYKLERYDEAIERYREELLIRENNSLNSAEDRVIGEIKKEIGYCYYHKLSYDEALRWLRESVEICERAPTSLTVATTAFIAELGIGKVQMDIGLYVEAVDTLLCSVLKLMPAWRNEEVKNLLRDFAWKMSKSRDNRSNQWAYFLKHADELREQSILMRNSCKSFMDWLQWIEECLSQMNKHKVEFCAS